MDFIRTEAAQELSILVNTIAGSICTPEHQRFLDGLDQRFDETLWRTLRDADILSTAAPESVGGGGFGVIEQAAILTALGRHLAAVPYLESVMLAAGALTRSDSDVLRRTWARPAVSGERILTIALDGEVGQPPVTATSIPGATDSPAVEPRCLSGRWPMLSSFRPSFRPKPTPERGWFSSAPPTPVFRLHRCTPPEGRVPGTSSSPVPRSRPTECSAGAVLCRG